MALVFVGGGGAETPRSQNRARGDSLGHELGAGAAGITSSGMPPGPISIKKILPGSWADKCGFSVGDEFLAVNGVCVPDLDEITFRAHMQARPLKIEIRPQQPAQPAHQEVSSQPTIAPQQAASKTVCLEFLPQRGAAGQAGLPPLALPQRPETPRDGSETPRGNRTPNSKRANSFDYEVAEGTAGIVPSGKPPGPVSVKRVAPGSWAEEAGVLAGDEILAVNGVDIEDLDWVTFHTHMQARPLNIEIRPQVPESAEFFTQPTDAPQETAARKLMFLEFPLQPASAPQKVVIEEQHAQVKQQQQTKAQPVSLAQPSRTTVLRLIFCTVLFILVRRARAKRLGVPLA